MFAFFASLTLGFFSALERAKFCRFYAHSNFDNFSIYTLYNLVSSVEKMTHVGEREREEVNKH